MFLPDIGNAHVIDWYCWRALRHKTERLYAACDGYFHPEDWSRYDGEIL